MSILLPPSRSAPVSPRMTPLPSPTEERARLELAPAATHPGHPDSADPAHDGGAPASSADHHHHGLPRGLSFHLPHTRSHRSAGSGSAGSQPHHIHHHAYHPSAPAWSVAVPQHAGLGGYYGAPSGGYYDASGFQDQYAMRSANTRRKAEPLYGLSRPLPTLEEVRALKRMKAAQKSGSLQGRNVGGAMRPDHRNERAKLNRSSHSTLGSKSVAEASGGGMQNLSVPAQNASASNSSPELRLHRAITPVIGPGHSAFGAPGGPGGDPHAPLIMATPEMLRALLNEARRNPVGPADEDNVDHLAVLNSGTLVAPSEKQKRSDSDLNGTDEKNANGKVLDPAPFERRDTLDSNSSHTDTVDSDASEDVIDFPNPIAKFRYWIREPAAEMLGTCFLILFGNGVDCQATLSTNTAVASSPKGQYLSISFGWGIGVLTGVYVSGGISGGHINPAVTICLAVFRGFPWRKVPGYIFAQCLGAFIGAVLVQAVYTNALNIFEGGVGVRTVLNTETSTASLFYTMPLPYMSDVNCFFSEYLDTAILIIVIFAIGDRNNSPPPDGTNPFVLLWLVVGLGACLGMQTAYAVNPARDFGPRLMAAAFGYGGPVWSFRNQYWLWTPWIATISGGLTGAFIYDLLIYTGGESPLNKRWKGRFGFGKGSKEKMPAGQDKV